MKALKVRIKKNSKAKYLVGMEGKVIFRGEERILVELNPFADGEPRNFSFRPSELELVK